MGKVMGTKTWIVLTAGAAAGWWSLYGLGGYRGKHLELLRPGRAVRTVSLAVPWLLLAPPCPAQPSWVWSLRKGGGRSLITKAPGDDLRQQAGTGRPPQPQHTWPPPGLHQQTPWSLLSTRGAWIDHPQGHQELRRRQPLTAAQMPEQLPCQTSMETSLALVNKWGG